MPVTKFQREIMLLLKQHRNPNSYIAGGVAIHRLPNSFRHSNDIDFFHDTAEAVTTGAKLDRDLLNLEGFKIQTLIEQPSFVRAIVSKGKESLRLEWVRDTAFRFFPVVEDNDLGYRLHDVDLAINKSIALANREEVRDIIDLIQLQRDTISLAGAFWAACGKDPGFTPELLLSNIRQHSIIRPEQLAAESLTFKLTAPELKQKWLLLLEETAKTLSQFPAKDLGCIYLNANGEACRDLDTSSLSNYMKHFGSIGGSWPRIID